MQPRYLLVADPVETLNSEFDLGVCVSRELIRRGLHVDYLDLLASDVSLPSERYLAALPVREILSSDASQLPFWELGPQREADLREYEVILQRKDPPVDETFVAYCRHFERAPQEVLQINRPPATYQLSEHTLILDYPQFAAPTWVCSTAAELIEAVRLQPGEAVAKPKSTYCGIGIAFFAPETAERTLHEYWKKWGPEVVVQPYLEAIEETGDLRILTLNGRVLGSVLRVPRSGSRLANLHQGATAARLEPTARQLEACRVISRDLVQKGLYLLGFDFIGEHLTEVNITSPTTIVQIGQVMGKRAEVEMVDELEQMRMARLR
jgi:glutathione synthase